nr:hypothetical protein [Tanacetum cinerariifolium]
MNAGELPEIDPYEEVAQQEQAHPLSPAYVPDPMELDDNVLVYVPEPEHSEYHAPSDDDIQVEDYNEDPEKDPKEDPSEEHKPEDDDEDPEEDPNEEYESKGSEETEPFKEDEIAIIPPPPRHHGARISVRPQTPMDASTQALIEAFASGSSLFPLPDASKIYHFSLDDSFKDSSSSSSSETSSYSSADVLYDFASSHSSSDHSLPVPSSGMRPSHHLCSLILCCISIPRALSYARADHLPSPKRIRSSEIAIDLEVSSKDRFEPYVPKGTDLEMDVDVVRSDGIGIDPEIQAEIEECIAYADSLRDRGIDARVLVEAVDRDEVETGTRGPIKVRVDRVTHPVTTDDIPEPAQEEGAVEVTNETLGDLVQRFHDHIVEILVHRV